MKKMKRQWLAVGIILLFVGVTIAPTINYNVVEASTDDDLVEVTTQACGIQGYGNSTVKLTREQYQDLKQYLVEFRARINQTTTREEAIPIFEEAVVQFEKYGLLPKGMTVAQAKHLLTDHHILSTRTTQLREKISPFLDEYENAVCLLAGSFTGSVPHSPVDMMINRIFWLFEPLYEEHPTRIIELLLEIILYIYIGSFFLSTLLFYIIPFHLFLTISMGYTAFGAYVPAFGSLTTIGLNGLKQWSGGMCGALPFLPRIPYPTQDTPGIYGFTGFAWYNVFTDDELFYVGSALWVRIEPY